MWAKNLTFRAAERIDYFQQNNKLIEAQRIEQRTHYDMEMLKEVGYCSGVENYSRVLAGRPAGSTPLTLMDHFPEDFLLIVDESHVTLPQVRAMYAGDRARKTTLVDYGFRLPSAMDNRPLNFDEFNAHIHQAIYVSATPGQIEREKTAAYTTAGEIKELAPDGIMFSNGPGDPAENVEIIENIKEIQKLGIPIFGICLGHQLMALANGGKTEKLKYGHRGANQPVIDLESGLTYVTSQNHGYAVVGDSIDPSVGRVSHINANDKTCEGIRYTSVNARTVQFHPEAHGGPLDTSYLFDEFVKTMQNA